MACFTAPLAGAAVAAVVQKTAGGKSSNPFLRKLHCLVKMSLGGSFLLATLGGSFLLAIEHIYHGEITFFPPFLTAMKDPNDTKEMIHEIMTVGVSMAVLLLVAWIGMVVVSEIAERRKAVLHV